MTIRKKSWPKGSRMDQMAPLSLAPLSDPKCEMIKSFSVKMPLGEYAYPGYY